MKFSLQWLKDYVNVSASPEALAHRLTMAGLEVEKIFDAEGGQKVFELEITPNRPDCLNIVGLAREVSAIYGKTLKLPKLKKFTAPKKKFDVTIADKDLCGRYLGIVIRNVKVGASPQWLKERVEAVGMRSINNIVDITNFCLMELGQPLHAFDLDKLNGQKIVVRRAKNGESMVTIDGDEHKLDPSVLVIADAVRPVAIAGIMGGKDTEVSFATKNILLESGYFDQGAIRRAGRKSGLSSDSSYRFERGVDRDMVLGGALRAAALILELAGGSVDAYADIFPGVKKVQRKAVNVSVSAVNALLGSEVSAQRCKTIMEKLGCKVSGNKDVLKIIPPVFRADLKAEVDIAEEIARVIGYDELPLTIPSIKMSNITTAPSWRCKNRLRDILTAQGLDETITYAMTHKKALEKCGLGQVSGIRIKNPLSQDQEMLRPSLLPGLLNVLSLNLSRGQREVKVFEIGKSYSAVPEKEVLAVLMSGSRMDDWRQMAKEPVDFYDVKGRLESILREYRIADVSFVKTSHPSYEDGQCAVVRVNGQDRGMIGKIAKNVLDQNDIKRASVYFAQLDLEWLYSSEGQERRYQPPSEFPAIVRDVSLAVKRDIPFEDIRAAILPMGEGQLASVKFLEQYVGEKIPAGQKGIIFSLVYQSAIRTLKEEEINAVHERICQALVQKFNAIRR